MMMRKLFILLAVLLPFFVFVSSKFWPPAIWFFIVLLPLIAVGIFDMLQRTHSVLRLYPIIGHLRFLFESIRPEIQQYFVETNTNGQPVSREFRSLVYQRAKGDRDTRPFGTQFDVYRDGHEWINHSLNPKAVRDHHPRIRFGGAACSQPYEASPLNISAMSFGALSRNAILALNKGAKTGGFAHNTGEGGISPYHLENGGDLIWQIGTGYFGCRNHDGSFDAVLFKEKASLEAVKMIEIKLSQGAKPGHGGILPAVKLTPEIAEIRNVPLGHDVISPPAHTAFSSPAGLLEYVAKLRELSGGKPVGFKLCIGSKTEFLAICKAIRKHDIMPDFITIDGAEGGTGAAPIELANSVGTPLRDGLIFVQNALIGTGLRSSLRLIASGKAFSAFHLLRLLALGADTVNAARAMMFALGCIQALHCNNDTCPTGIATQNPTRNKALDVNHKAARVANYHAAMIENLLELVAAAGLNSLDELRPWHIVRRVSGSDVRHYDQLFPCISANSLLDDDSIPPAWRNVWSRANPESWPYR